MRQPFLDTNQTTTRPSGRDFVIALAVLAGTDGAFMVLPDHTGRCVPEE